MIYIVPLMKLTVRTALKDTELPDRPGQSTSIKGVNSDPNGLHNDSASQQAVNLQILSQLRNPGKRLDVIAVKEC